MVKYKPLMGNPKANSPHGMFAFHNPFPMAN
jgi:hypothetical protein